MGDLYLSHLSEPALGGAGERMVWVDGVGVVGWVSGSAWVDEDGWVAL